MDNIERNVNNRPSNNQNIPDNLCNNDENPKHVCDDELSRDLENILNYIKEDIERIQAILTNPRCGLGVINSKIKKAESLLNNPNFSLKELKSTLLNLVDAFEYTSEKLTKFLSHISEISNLLKNPFFGLCEIKKEVQAIETAVLNSSYGLKAIDTKLTTIEENTRNTSTVLEEIKSEISLLQRSIESVLSILDEMNNVQNYTTGIVAADRNAKSLFTIINNNSPSEQFVTINVIIYSFFDAAANNLTVAQNSAVAQKLQPMKGTDEKIIIPPNSTITSVYQLEPRIANSSLLLYEVEYLGLGRGVTTYTATRIEPAEEGIENSTWIPSNVYRHSELVPL